SILPAMPPAVAEIVDRALAQAPADRWSDARTMQEACAAAFARLSGRHLTPSERVFAPPTRPTHSPAAFAATAPMLTTGKPLMTDAVQARTRSRIGVIAIAGAAAVGFTVLGIVAAERGFFRRAPTPAPMPARVATPTPSAVSPPPPEAPSASAAP